MHKAVKMLEESAKWREEVCECLRVNPSALRLNQTKPHLISPDEVESEAALDKLYHFGFTKAGNPVVCMRPGIADILRIAPCFLMHS